MTEEDGLPDEDTGMAARVGDPVASPAPETRRLYAGDWARFAAWCREAGQIALPAAPATVAAYLLAEAPSYRRGTLGRRKAAIRAMHRQQSLPIPVLDDAARAALRTTGRRGAASGQRTAPTATLLARMAAGCPRDLAGLRDRALLLLVAAIMRGPGRVTHAGLLGLDAEHVRSTAAGAVLRLRVRADEAEPFQVMTLTRAPISAGCPVRALETWLEASATAFGPVFRKVDRWGNVEHRRLGTDALRRIWLRRATT